MENFRRESKDLHGCHVARNDVLPKWRAYSQLSVIALLFSLILKWMSKVISFWWPKDKET